jgi:hypothetical protein
MILKNLVSIFLRIYTFSVLPYMKKHSRNAFSLCVCMNEPIAAHKSLDGFCSYLVCRNLSVIGRGPVITNILPIKLGALSLGLPEQNGEFLINGCGNSH